MVSSPNNNGNGQLAYTGFDDLISRLELLKQDDRVAVDYVGFRIEVARILRAAGETEAALTRSAIRANGAGTRANLDRWFDLLADATIHYGGQSEHMTRLLLARDADPELVNNLVNAQRSPDREYILAELEHKLKIPAGFLCYIGAVLASPVAVAELQDQDVSLSSVHEGAESSLCCPSCNGLPALSRLQLDDGKRQLLCGICSQPWYFSRVRCPSCGCTDQTKLGVLIAGDSATEAIETCDECRHYIKVIDDRNLKEHDSVPPFVFETATVHLDLIAEQEGYQRRMPYVSIL